MAVEGPWRAWEQALSRDEAERRCGATARQVVCATASGGLTGRSRADGAVTWVVPGDGGDGGGGVGSVDGTLVVDSADERAVITAGRVLRAADLRTGEQARTRRVPDGRVYYAVATEGGTVCALDATARRTEVTLRAYRASDGSALWQRKLDADLSGGPVAFGGRVYVTDGARVTARDARAGAGAASSPSGTGCPYLIAGGGHLVCTGSPLAAGDTFPPLQRLDTATLRPLATAEDTGLKPFGGLISSDGVLVLYEDSAAQWR